MKQQLLWVIAGLLLSTSSLATAQNDKQTPKVEPGSTPKITISIEARGAYDPRNYYAEPDFSPATIPMKSDPTNRKRFFFDIPSATLSVEKVFALTEGEVIKLVMQAGLKKELALKSVYADFKGFRVGKATSNFCDPDACDLVGGRFLQARWQHKLNTSFRYTVAIEEAPDLVIDPTVKKEDRDKQNLQFQKNIPAISASARYEQEKMWHVQVSGLLRSLEYHNVKASVDSYMPTWGVNMGAALHLVPEKTTFTLQGVYGRGIGDYMADLGDLKKEANTVYVKKDDASTLETLNAWSVGFGIVHKWLPKLCSEVAYRFLDTQHGQRGDNDDAYKRGHFASVNLFYHPSEQIKIGTEYLFGARENVSGELKDGHRVQAVVGFEL
jgi:DcaP outer membrane protein